jgi:uncharacterized protein (TIGR02246 family)
MRRRVALVLASVLLVTQVEAAAPEDSKIRELDAAWLQAVKAKDLDRILTYYAPDGTLLADGATTVTGPTGIKGVWQYMLATPGFDLTFTPGHIRVSRAGDMAMDIGTFELVTSGPQGGPVKEVGKYVVVWTRQPDRQWRVSADIFNSSPE